VISSLGIDHRQQRALGSTGQDEAILVVAAAIVQAFDPEWVFENFDRQFETDSMA
jgi:hypothetical protein